MTERAEVTTYGGDRHTMRHWQLVVGDSFIGETSIPSVGRVFVEIARRWNSAEDEPDDGMTVCEGCGALVLIEALRPEIEGVPLCPECSEAAPRWKPCPPCRFCGSDEALDTLDGDLQWVHRACYETAGLAEMGDADV